MLDACKIGSDACSVRGLHTILLKGRFYVFGGEDTLRQMLLSYIAAM